MLPKNTTSWHLPTGISDRLKVQKCIFQAHATPLPDPALFPEFLAHLKRSRDLKGATHCIYAFRAPGSTGQNDGGESGGGNYISRLLQMQAGGNAAVVVSRWYGGRKLGSDRWRAIRTVSREALDRAGLLKAQAPAKQRKGLAT